mgnify:FL=1
MKKLYFVFTVLLLACSCKTLAPSGDTETAGGNYFRLASVVMQETDKSPCALFTSPVYTADSRTGNALLESFYDTPNKRTVRFMYALPLFVYVYNDEVAKCRIKLNADGLVSDISINGINDFDAESYYYEYDEFSRLKKKTYRDSYGHSECYNFTYSEVGNISHIKGDYQYNIKGDYQYNHHEEWEYSVEYADIPAKTAPLQFLVGGDMFAEIFEPNEWVLMEAGLLGNTFPHLLIQSLTGTDLDDDFMSLFSYKLDKNGYVSEMTMVNSCDDSTAPDVVTCNFTWEKSSAPSYAQWHLNEK